MSLLASSRQELGDTEGKSDRHSDIAAARWTLWLPLIVLGLAMYAAEHRIPYASPAYQEDGDRSDIQLEAEGSSTLRQLAILSLGAVGSLLLIMPSKVEIRTSPTLLAVATGMCGLLVASSLWSPVPEMSLKRAVQPVIVMIGALGIVKHWTPRQLCRFSAIFAGLVLIYGMVVVFAYGTFMIGDAYRFGGTLHPNGQAVNCAILCLASLTLFFDWRHAGRVRWRWLGVFLIGFMFLVLTRSRTTAVAFLASLFVFTLIGASWRQRFALSLIPLALAFVCGVLWFAADYEGRGLFMRAVQMGRDNEDLSSLTGRVPIWNVLIRDIAQRPLLGYGYGGFWTAQRVWEYSFIRHWEFNHAHSAYLETMLNTGMFGLALGLIAVIVAGNSAASAFATTGDYGYRFIAAVLAFGLVHGFVDSNFVVLGYAPTIVALCLSMLALHRSAPVSATLSVHVNGTQSASERPPLMGARFAV